MDEVVKVRRSFLNRIRGFLNVFSDACRGCLRRNKINCAECEGLRARELVAEIDNVRNASEERYWIENPFDELLRKIMKAVEQSGGKSRPREIRIDGVGRQRKYKAIKKLVRRGMLKRTTEDGETFFVLVTSGKTTTTHKKDKRNGIQS